MTLVLLHELQNFAVHLRWRLPLQVMQCAFNDEVENTCGMKRLAMLGEVLYVTPQQTDILWRHVKGTAHGPFSRLSLTCQAASTLAPPHLLLGHVRRGRGAADRIIPIRTDVGTAVPVSCLHTCAGTYDVQMPLLRSPCLAFCLPPPHLRPPPLPTVAPQTNCLHLPSLTVPRMRAAGVPAASRHPAHRRRLRHSQRFAHRRVTPKPFTQASQRQTHALNTDWSSRAYSSPTLISIARPTYSIYVINVVASAPSCLFAALSPLCALVGAPVLSGAAV